jgi:hypothetical protein
MTMQTFIFAGDESGDVSFNFAKGASRYFVVTAIGTTQPQTVRESLAYVQKSVGLPAQYEFSFNGLASQRLRQLVFATLARSDFEAWAVVADKVALPDIFRLMPRLDFYLYFVTELLQSIPVQRREGATLILDEYRAEGRLPVELRRYLKVRNIPRHFQRILVKRSRSEPLIQVADLVGGALLRRDTHHETDTFEMIENKFKGIVIYPR